MNNAIATQQSTAPIQVGLADSQSFELAQRVAKCFASSTLVPKAYQGNLPNCVIALNMAARMGADPMMVMQSLYVVHGTPSWSAQFLIATFNKCGRFSSIRYAFSGTEGQDDWGCRATAVELSTGDVLTGPLVTIALAKKEGWHQKTGSKWQTMPEQMLRYRAAAWFVRTIAPEIAMGLQTSEEVRDAYDLEPVGDSYMVPVRGEVATDLNDIISAPTTEKSSEVQEEPQEEKKRRLTAEELDGMRFELCSVIGDEGLRLEDVEKAAGEYSNRWSEKIMQKIENVIIPNMKAEMMGA